MKVATIVGTRPELVKLSCEIWELDRTVERVLVHTGQNYDYELNEIFFGELGIRRPDHFLDVAGGTLRQAHKRPEGDGCRNADHAGPRGHTSA